MNRHRLAVTSLCSLAAATVCAAPAGAAPAPMVAGASFARTVPFIDGTIYAFECHAAAPGATSTTISSCALSDGLHTIAAPPTTSAGPAAVTTQAVATTPVSQWKVCWTAGAAYADGTTQSTSGCTTASSLAGAGVS
jgi:hypothetical protein